MSVTPQRREPLVYAFGPFRFRADELLLYRDGAPIALNPKTLETLRVLIENAGRLVTREELIELVWPNTAVTDASLTQNVWLLRKALHDEEEGMTFIETLPRRGYRFVGEVTATIEPATAIPIVPAAGAPATPAVETTVPAIAAPPRLRRAHLWIGAAVILAALVAVLFGSRWLRRADDAPSGPRRKVAVFDLRNASGRADVAWVSTALAESVAAELAAGEQLRTVPGETVASLSRELRLTPGETLSKDTLARIRRGTGADLVVVGSYLSLGSAGDGRLRIDIRIQDTRSGEVLATVAETVSQEQLIDVTGRIGQQLRAGLLVHEPSGDSSLAARASLPSNLTASRHYAVGLSALRRFDGMAAVDNLKKAVASDPSFPLAHAALSAAYSSIGRDQDAKDEILRAAQLATGLSREERMQIEARQALAANEWARAADLFRSLWRFFPDTPAYAIEAAAAQVKGSDAKGALATLGELPRASLTGIDRARADVLTAEAQTILGDFDKAMLHTTSAVAEATAAGAPGLVAEAKRRQASVLENLGKPDEATKRLEEARDVSLRAGDRRNAAAAVASLAEIAATSEDSDRGIELLRQALAIFREAGDNRGMATVLNDIGNALADIDNDGEAREALNESLALRRSIRDRKGESSALLNLGRIEKKAGNMAEAKALYQQSLAIKREIGDRPGIARLTTNLGNIASYEGDPRTAIKLYEESIAISRATGEKRSLALALTNISVNLLDLGQPAQALKYANEALPIHRETKNVSNLVNTLNTLALIAEVEGRLDDAAGLQQEALTIAQTAKNRTAEILARKHLAQVALARRDTRDALQHLAAVDRMNGPDLAAEIGEVPNALRSLALAMEGRRAEATRVRAAVEKTLPGMLASWRTSILPMLAESAMLSGDPGAARRLAAQGLSEARQLSYGLSELESRAVLASTESGADARRAALQQVRTDAQKLGYIQLVREIDSQLR